MRPLLLLLAGLLLQSAAWAQLIDELELRREGADAVLHIRFVTPVQYLRAVTAKSADQTLLFYRVLPAAQTLDRVASERQLTPRAGSTLPGITVSDEAGNGRSADERRLLVRLASPANHRARAGRGNRTVDIVLEGLGSQVAPAPGADLPAALLGQLRVTLEASEQAGAFLSAPIPAVLQNVNVFTSRRVVGGKVVFETHLGPFASRAEAESALRAVRGRFPQAQVTSEDAPGTLRVATAPAAVAAPAAVVVAPTAAASAPSNPVSVAAVPAPTAPTPAPQAAASAPAATVGPVAAASAPTPTAAAPVLPAAVAVTTLGVALATPADAELERQARGLLISAREALASGAANTAIDLLSRLLDLPPTKSSREAQAMIGQARLKDGDTGRARAEFDAFLRLYPTGTDSDRVRAALAGLEGSSTQAAAGPAGGSTAGPAPAPAGGPRAVAPTTTLTGSVSSFYYGGQSKVRTQEFQESAIGGLPQLISDATLSDTDQSQLISAVDVNWRHRDADVDQRFVFRDTYSKDFKRPDKSRNRLSALYFDQRSFANGTSFRVGRQTPLGGGVLGRFDGVQAGYAFQPRWKASVVAGVPTDSLLDARRHFFGASVEAEALTPKLGGSLYLIEQKIDGQTDRRALGSDLRYFDGGLSMSGQLDYDVVLKGLNIVSLQGTWQRPDNTVLNVLFDRRKTPLLSLGNALFFPGSLVPPPTRINDLLATGAATGLTVGTLRQQVRDTTADSTQAALGVTTPITPSWQLGADVRYTNTGAVAPVPDLLPQGQPSTGDIWSLSLQLIGTNLYSLRDTHVVIANFINGPGFQGQLLSYNNSSLIWQAWQLEPSIKFYRQITNDNVRSTRWAPGLRLTYRVRQEISLESEVNVESSKTTSPTRNEASTRTFYYLGGRYDF